MKYLRKFDNHASYEEARQNLILPNVSYCVSENEVHYNPYVEPVETRVVAKLNVTDTSSPTQIISEYASSPFSEIEIDGVVQPSVVSAYTFTTTGEHTVKYTLTDQTTIGSSAFDGCIGITSINIPNSVTSIGQGAFYGCSSLTSIVIPSGVTSIDYGTFWYCSGLTSVTIGNSVTSIGENAFRECSSLTSINIPSGVTSIGNKAFEYCTSLTSITIGGGVTSIGSAAFLACSGLTSIDIPNSVTTIGNSAFKDCSSLTSITIGNSLTTIGYSAFQDCSGLTIIVCNATTAPTITNNTFERVKTGGTLAVPSGSSGYDTWMQNTNYYLGLYNWTKVEQ